MNPVQSFGLLMLGGMVSGEICRRLFNLPRTTGYVVFGLCCGESGWGWIDAKMILSAQFFIDLALGLIVFELGQRLHGQEQPLLMPRRQVILAGLTESAVSFVALTGLLLILHVSLPLALLAGAIGVSTSPAITIATSSDVGARGNKSQILYHCVAINCCVAFVLTTLFFPALNDGLWSWPGLSISLGSITASLFLGICGATVVLYGAALLGKHPEHQHMLLLSVILIAVGVAITLGMSVLLSLLVLGTLSHHLDYKKQVVAIRISSDARIFLVVTFVLAGASLNIRTLIDYWDVALLFALTRFASKVVPLFLLRQRLGLNDTEAAMLGVGLMPMSSVALVLLADGGAGSAGNGQLLFGSLLGSILLMQLLGPLATQSAIRSFGEASTLPEKIRRPPGAS